jgi:histidyl-tRNA synthetase
MDKSKIRPIRGTKDLISEEARLFDFIIKKSCEVFENYGYSPIYTPIIEFSEIFSRTLGDFSDVVSKEMYSFTDRSNESITMRPEFTAGVARACISNSLLQNLPLRIYTHGPLFRYERPQLGRQRQFHQVNVECLGIANPRADAEIIAMAMSLIKNLGLHDVTTLNINSLGCSESRKNYTQSLKDYFIKYKDDLSEDSKIRLEKNPLRILDSKNEDDQKIAATAPSIEESYSEESKKFFGLLQEYLALLDIKFYINKSLVRGLDYYCHTTFEITTDKLGSQSAVLGGGRYDKLMEMLGGPATPGVGFGAGLERLLLLLKEQEININSINVIAIGAEAVKNKALVVANILRASGLRVIDNYDDSLNRAIKKANRDASKFVIFIGDEELTSNLIKLKNFVTGEQELISVEGAINKIKGSFV